MEAEALLKEWFSPNIQMYTVVGLHDLKVVEVNGDGIVLYSLIRTSQIQWKTKLPPSCFD